MLAGLTVMLAVTFLLGSALIEDVLARRLFAAAHDDLTHIAAAVDRMPLDSRHAMVSAGAISAFVVAHEAHGPATVLREMRKAGPQDQFVRNGAELYFVARHNDAIVARRADSLSDDVAGARGSIALFGILVGVVLLALQYAFFGFVVVRPIRAIGVATERAGQGDLASPITIVPRNEIGSVARSFNEMLVRIEDNRAELQERLNELERTNRELESTRDTLVRSEKLASVGQLAAGIAHEIGNPMAAVSGYLELLQSGDLEPDEAADLLERCHAQLDRIQEVIRSLLDFSRDERTTDPMPTDLQQCVKEAVSLVRAAARSREAQVHAENMEGDYALAVPSQIVQVLVNLLFNAVDALDGDAGVVRVGREEVSDFIYLHVDDSGPGVPAEIAVRIFDPFFTTKDPGEGTGLGLAISARIIEGFGGSLEVGSSDLGGARFTVVLPRAQGQG